MSYLFPFIYLYLHSMTRIVVEGREVLIQKIAESSKWKLSTPIFGGRGEFPKEMHECLKMIQQLKWESEGMLEIDAVVGTIHWTHEVDPSNFGKDFPLFLQACPRMGRHLDQRTFSKRNGSLKLIMQQLGG